MFDPVSKAAVDAVLPCPLPAEIGTDIRALTVSTHDTSTTLRYSPPMHPGREVWEYSDGDDEPHYVRDCTPEELAAREARYREAKAEWTRTLGLLRTKGPPVHVVNVSTELGEFELRGDGRAWWVVSERRHG